MDNPTFSPSDVILSFGGYNLDNWESISLKREVSLSRPIRGIRGKNTRVLHRNTAATITLVCAQTSLVHDILSQVLAADLISAGGARLEISILDRNGGLSFSSSEAYVVGYPEQKYSNTIEEYTWTIYCQSSSQTGMTSKRPETSLFDSALRYLIN